MKMLMTKHRNREKFRITEPVLKSVTEVMWMVCRQDKFYADDAVDEIIALCLSLKDARRVKAGLEKLADD